MPARLTLSLTLLSASGCLLLAAATGCEDASARARADAQVVLDEASRDLALATLTAESGSTDEASRKLRDVAQAVSQLSEADDGQQVAGALLATAAHQQLAATSLARARQVESAGRRALSEVHSSIDAAMRLRSMIASRESIDASANRAELARHLTSAQTELRGLREELADLQRPIAEREAENADDLREISRLDDEANALRRQASEWGPADGLPTFRQALQLERESDRYAMQVARREGDLQYDLRPEHDLVSQRVDALETGLREVRSATSSLDRGAAQTAADLEQTRELLATFEERIVGTLAVLASEITEAVDAQYADADRHIEQAVRAAKKAVGKSPRADADSALLVLVRSYQQQAQLHAARHRSLSARRVLLERLADTEMFDDAERAGAALEATSAAEAEAGQKAIESLQQASEQLEKVRGRTSGAEVDAFKARLAASLATLTGTEVEAPPTRRPPPPASRAPDRAASAGGYDSPEALLADVQASGDADSAALTRLMGAMHTEDANVERLLAIQRASAGASIDFVTAMREQFGEGAERELLQGMGAGMSSGSYENPVIEDRADDRATVVYDTPAGPGTGRMELVVVGGSWVIDADAMFPAMDEAMIAQTEQMMPAIQAVMADLAGRIRAGEFSSPDEIAQVMMGEMMKQLGGPGGG